MICPQSGRLSTVLADLRHETWFFLAGSFVQILIVGKASMNSSPRPHQSGLAFPPPRGLASRAMPRNGEQLLSSIKDLVVQHVYLRRLSSECGVRRGTAVVQRN